MTKIQQWCDALDMLDIYMVRHGQDHDNQNSILNGQRDTSLTAVGEKQALELREKLLKLNIQFNYVFSSPLQRAFRTAELIIDPKYSTPSVLPDLIERNFGIMTGKTHKEIIPLCSPEILKTDTITYFLSPEGAETFPELIIRGTRVLQELESNYSNGNVLLVTHGDIGKMIYCAYFKLDWRDVLQNFHFGNLDVLLLSSSISSDQSHVIKTQQYNI